ncbi:hypothetical protein BHQ17_27130 [Mycolicibacterium holsaticum]|uniref:Uncharacterized protein n=1 Tax=Mycolicibacterium holsaticum TaxID=152142 RepID=A0A1E3R3K8_9MYCO|nr:hypothetical protein BHQ17_27130 [Mycolicibacterium holsaticum]
MKISAGSSGPRLRQPSARLTPGSCFFLMRAPCPESVPPPEPPPPPAAWVHRFHAPPAMPRPLPVAPTADWNSLWGIAGLLLIPAAGAALGYRQARAAQTAERIR